MVPFRRSSSEPTVTDGASLGAIYGAIPKIVVGTRRKRDRQ
jgi:hypothetical protein